MASPVFSRVCWGLWISAPYPSRCAKKVGSVAFFAGVRGGDHVFVLRIANETKEQLCPIRFGLTIYITYDIIVITSWLFDTPIAHRRKSPRT